MSILEVMERRLAKTVEDALRDTRAAFGRRPEAYPVGGFPGYDPYRQVAYVITLDGVDYNVDRAEMEVLLDAGPSTLEA